MADGMKVRPQYPAYTSLSRAISSLATGVCFIKNLNNLRSEFQE